MKDSRTPMERFWDYLCVKPRDALEDNTLRQLLLPFL